PAQPSSSNLTDGDQVKVTEIPVEISSMLDQADALLNAVGDSQIRSVMDEAFLAFNGTGEDLQRLMDSMTLFVGELDKNVDTTVDLVRQAGPLLATQNRTADDIRSWTKDLVTVTDQLRASRPDVSDILAKGPGVASQTQALFESMNTSFPLAVSNLKVAAHTQSVYLPNLQQIVVLYPRVLSALITAINSGSNRHGPNVNFGLGFQDPPACTVGFMPPDQWRFPSVQDARELPPGLLCRLPQDSQTAVRGARNFPCAEFPGRRAPTPAECRTGFKPDPQRNLAFPNGLPGTNLPKDPKPANKPSSYVVPGTPTDYDPSPAVYATTYDPETGQFIGPDGKTYVTSENDSAKAKNKSGTWTDLITNPVEN
ncbi:MAG: MCE family protein, partial [Gordonia sp. (in: high G+C Gram-positive bacteria)]